MNFLSYIFPTMKSLNLSWKNLLPIIKFLFYLSFCPVYIPPVPFPPAFCPSAYSTCSSFSCLPGYQLTSLLLTSSAPFPHATCPSAYSTCSSFSYSLLLSTWLQLTNLPPLPILTFILFPFLLLAVLLLIPPILIFLLLTAPAYLAPPH
jgi:hypothetical protein